VGMGSVKSDEAEDSDILGENKETNMAKSDAEPVTGKLC
jgi:hypothetical protein